MNKREIAEKVIEFVKGLGATKEEGRKGIRYANHLLIEKSNASTRK